MFTGNVPSYVWLSRAYVLHWTVQLTCFNAVAPNCRYPELLHFSARGIVGNPAADTANSFKGNCFVTDFCTIQLRSALVGP